MSSLQSASLLISKTNHTVMEPPLLILLLIIMINGETEVTLITNNIQVVMPVRNCGNADHYPAEGIPVGPPSSVWF